MNSARSTSGRQTQSNDFFFPKVFDVFLPLPCRGFFSSASVIPRGSLSLLSCLKEDAPTLGCPMFEALVVRFGSVLFYSRSACNWGKASGHLYAPPHRPESLSLCPTLEEEVNSAEGRELPGSLQHQRFSGQRERDEGRAEKFTPMISLSLSSTTRIVIEPKTSIM